GNTPIKTSPLIKSLLWPHRPTLKNLQRDQLPPYIPTQGTPMPAPQKNCLSYTQGQSLASPPRLALNTFLNSFPRLCPRLRIYSHSEMSKPHPQEDRQRCLVQSVWRLAYNSLLSYDFPFGLMVFEKTCNIEKPHILPMNTFIPFDN